MKFNILTVLLLTGLVSGCTATITPRGDVYAEGPLPSTVVIEERYASPVVITTRPAVPLISWYRSHKHHPRHHAPAYRPSGHRLHGPVAHDHHPGRHKPHNTVISGNRHRPGGPNKPGDHPRGHRPQQPVHR